MISIRHFAEVMKHSDIHVANVILSITALSATFAQKTIMTKISTLSTTDMTLHGTLTLQQSTICHHHQAAPGITLKLLI